MVGKQFELLKKLQEIDISIDGLKEKLETLPEKEHSLELRQEVEKLRDQVSSKKSSLDKEQHVQKKIEDELALLDEKLEKEQEKLYTGNITNPKELAGIQEEVNSLGKRKDDMETKLLEQLDVVEKLASEADNLSSRLEESELELKELEKKWQQKREEIEKKIVDLERSKEKIASEVPEDLLLLYQKLREQKQGVAAVEVNEGVCLGCHMDLPSEEVDKMMHSCELWRCFHCGRILLR